MKGVAALMPALAAAILAGLAAGPAAADPAIPAGEAGGDGLPPAELVERMRRHIGEDLLPRLESRPARPPGAIPAPPQPAMPAGMPDPAASAHPADAARLPGDGELADKPASAGVFVLVSLGQRRSALATLAQQAHRAGAVLVLRGLRQRSLRKTAAEIARIREMAGPSAWMVDPLLFRRFGVRAVPAFIAASGAHAAAVAGDVSLGYALGELERTAPPGPRKVAAEAKRRLEDG